MYLYAYLILFSPHYIYSENKTPTATKYSTKCCIMSCLFSHCRNYCSRHITVTIKSGSRGLNSEREIYGEKILDLMD